MNAARYPRALSIRSMSAATHVHALREKSVKWGDAEVHIESSNAMAGREGAGQ